MCCVIPLKSSGGNKLSSWLLAALRFKQVPTIYQVKDKDRANSQMKVDVPLSVYRQPLSVIVFLQGTAHAGGVYLRLN